MARMQVLENAQRGDTRWFSYNSLSKPVHILETLYIKINVLNVFLPSGGNSIATRSWRARNSSVAPSLLARKMLHWMRAWTLDWIQGQLDKT